MKTFDYVIARKWDKSKPAAGNLAVYAFGSEIQHGDSDSAKQMLEYVKRQSPDKDWYIFVVDYSQILVV